MDSFEQFDVNEELGLLSTGCTVNSFALRIDSLPSESVTIHELLDGRGEKNEVIVLLLRLAIVTCGVYNLQI